MGKNTEYKYNLRTLLLLMQVKDEQGYKVRYAKLQEHIGTDTIRRMRNAKMYDQNFIKPETIAVMSVVLDCEWEYLLNYDPNDPEYWKEYFRHNKRHGREVNLGEIKKDLEEKLNGEENQTKKEETQAAA